MKSPDELRRDDTAPYAANRWKEIEAVLDEVLEAEGDQRAAFLDKVSTTDPALREAVELLLQSLENSGGFLEEPAQLRAMPVLHGITDLELQAAPGRRIGAYRIVRQIGRGGMGTVYLAARDDGAFEKDVALKILPSAWALDDALLRRFREERQILASLEHASIARLMDGGISDDGVPYFVMEYVAGTPIDRHCDDRELDIPRRIELIAAVCDAVQYAHDRHIVHRDLKPSNILVESDGQVKLLDFGIAKMLTGNESDEVTQPGLRMMTLQYASPEQILGGPVSPASDVYSLGVLLYRVLTGREPHSARSTARDIERAVVDGNTPPPSRAASDIVQRRQLRGDLDAIVLKALSPEPRVRYSTAGDLSADLRRYLGKRPVHARAGHRLRSVRALARSPGVRLAIAALLIFVIAAGALAIRGRPGVVPSDTVIAVLPFVPTVQDTALVRLGRDLALTLSVSLDGVGELRTIRVGTVPVGRDGLAGARELGAGVVLQGSLVRIGERVRTEAALVRTGNAAVVARATATASHEELPVLTDSLAWSLLRQIWRSGTPPTPSLEAITTRSIPALRAFLEGERFLLQERHREAIDAFARAIEADSGFAYAYWRYAHTSSQIDRPVDPVITRAYMAGREGFPERDRLHMEAEANDSLSVRVAMLRVLTERYKEHWPVHWDYADELVHYGSLLGYEYDAVIAALERTLRLNPRLHPAWRHLFWAASANGDIPTAERSFAELSRLRSGLAPATPQQGELALFRYVLHLLHSGGRVHPELADSMTAAMVRAASAVPPAAFANATLFYGFPGASVDVLGRALARSPPDPLARAASRGIAGAWAARGNWDSALASLARETDDRADPQLALAGYRLAAVGLWIGGVTEDEVRKWRASLVSASGRLTDAQRAEVAWLEGVVALALEDLNALRTARGVLSRGDPVTAPVLDKSLAAFERALRRDRGGAARMLVEAEHDRMNRYQRFREITDAHPFLTAVNRLTAARWLLASGDTASAAWLLVFHEGVPHPLPWTQHANYILSGPALLERARIEHAAGRNARARRLYSQFLQRYDSPGPAHRQWVAEARAAVTAVDPR